MNDTARLIDAIAFASERHRNQRRKDADETPYINHPIALARMLAFTGGVTDVEVLMAAILHDTIEDTETVAEEIRVRFGERVTRIVEEVTDDKSIEKARRKELQVEHATHKSREAALVKLADKTCNLIDVAASPPVNWSMERRREYFDWAARVIDRLPVVNDAMLAAFRQAYSLRP